MVTTVTDNSPQSINTSLFSLDKEVQEIKKVTDTFNDTLSGINTESGVISVNGKQGIVELTASDVDALPSSTVIPTTTSELENTSGFITINDVGSSFVPITRKVNNKQLNTDITLTASDVGALPDTTVIPTKTSQLTNDNGFITSSDSITGNAATATTAGTADRANNGTFGILGGAKLAVSHNFEDLLNNELCSNQSGGLRGGSIDVPAGQEAKNLGIPVDMWYNFLYIPHRTGINESGGVDNNMYGTLFVIPLTLNDRTFYIIHRISGYNFPAHRFDSAT